MERTPSPRAGSGPRPWPAVAGIAVASVAVPAAVAVLLRMGLPGQPWVNAQLCAALEGAGATAALIVAALMSYSAQGRAERCVPQLCVAAGLLSMGVFGVLHAMAPPGSGSAVLLHCLGTLAGGALFALVWLPGRAASGLPRALSPAVVTGASLALGLGAAPLAALLRSAVSEHSFGTGPIALSAAGGALFLVAATELLRRYRAQGARNDLLFAVFALLFAAEGFAFGASKLWHADWWFWHFVRFGAYLVTLRFGLLVYRDTGVALEHELVLRAETEARGRERLAAQEALERSEQRYRAVMDSAGDAILLVELDGTVIEANLQAERLLGYGKAELAGMQVERLHPAREEARLHAAFRELAREGRTQYLDGVALTKDAREIPVDIVAVHLELDGRKIAQGTIRDISARKAAEEALRASEERYRDLFETSRDAICVNAMDGRYLDCNAAFLRLTGYASLEELKAYSYAELTPGEYHGLERRLVREQVLRRGYTDEYEKELIRKDGSRVPIRIHVTLRRDPLGAPLEAWSIIRDLSESRSTQRQLRRSEEVFRQIAESIREVFWVATPDLSRILYVSPSTSEVFGLAPEELYRDPMAWRRVVHPDDLPAVRASLRQHTLGGGTQVDYRIVRGHGEVRWIRRRAYPWRSASGELLVTGIAEDVTALKREEQERLEEAWRQRDTLVREVHHRIKNNLQGVAGLLRQFAAQRPEVSAALEEAIAQVQSIGLVHGLQGQTGAKEILLCEMVPAICRAIEALFAGRIAVRAQLDLAVPQCVSEAEAVPVALIVNELIVNAAKHARGDGAVPRVDVQLSTSAIGATLSVRNPGGLPRNFDFERASSRGIGLDLVHSLLPGAGARLIFKTLQEGVEASLQLTAPIVAAQGDPRRASWEKERLTDGTQLDRRSRA